MELHRNSRGYLDGFLFVIGVSSPSHLTLYSGADQVGKIEHIDIAEMDGNHILMLFWSDVLITRRIWGYELLFAYLPLIRTGMMYNYGY